MSGPFGPCLRHEVSSRAHSHLSHRQSHVRIVGPGGARPSPDWARSVFQWRSPQALQSASGPLGPCLRPEVSSRAHSHQSHRQSSVPPLSELSDTLSSAFSFSITEGSQAGLNELSDAAATVVILQRHSLGCAGARARWACDLTHEEAPVKAELRDGKMIFRGPPRGPRTWWTDVVVTHVRAPDLKRPMHFGTMETPEQPSR